MSITARAIPISAKVSVGVSFRDPISVCTRIPPSAERYATHYTRVHVSPRNSQFAVPKLHPETVLFPTFPLPSTPHAPCLRTRSRLPSKLADHGSVNPHIPC